MYRAETSPELEIPAPTTVEDPFTIEAFHAWAAKQPADRQYNWDCASICAGAQYVRSVMPDAELAYQIFSHKLPRAIDACQRRPWNFGALTERLEQLL